MQNKGKSTIRTKAGTRALERLAMENVRRDFFSALGSLVVYSILFIRYLFAELFPIKNTIVLAIMVVYLAMDICFAVISYKKVVSRDSSRSGELNRVFWISRYGLALIFSLYASSKTGATLLILMIMLSFALVPLFELKEIVVATTLEVIMLVLHFAINMLDAERFVTGIIILTLCTVISRLAYYAALRREMDAGEISDVKNLADTDPMTGLLNRRGLERRIMQLWPMCIREKLSVAVMMIDIDNFKKYNDTFGHPEGDECIKMIAKCLKENIRRRTDYIARVGGEEFLIVLTDVTRQGAIDVATACKKSVEEARRPHSKDNFLPYVSISTGLSFASPVVPGKEFWELRNDADKQLYTAKENGKACVYIEGECFAKTEPLRFNRQYEKERLFHQI